MCKFIELNKGILRQYLIIYLYDRVYAILLCGLPAIHVYISNLRLYSENTGIRFLLESHNHYGELRFTKFGGNKSLVESQID